MNALLEHQSILPSSDDEACTSSVVEVSYSNSDNYEAHIEFVSEEVRAFISKLICFVSILSPLPWRGVFQEWQQQLKPLIEEHEVDGNK